MVNSKKIENVIKLSREERYWYFIRKVTDFQTVWGLYDDGWAIIEKQGEKGLPFWPELDFAALCATGNWASYKPREIALDIFLSKWLPGMQSNGEMVAIFLTPSDSAQVTTPERLSSDLKEELEQYE